MTKKKTTKKISLDEYADQLLNKSMKKIMADLPQKMEGVMERVIWSLLGVGNPHTSHGRAEVDHCNGRWNMFKEVLESEAKESVVKAVKGLKLKYSIKDFESAFQREYVQHFKHQLEWYAKKAAQGAVDKHLDQLIARNVEKMKITKIETPRT